MSMGVSEGTDPELEALWGAVELQRREMELRTDGSTISMERAAKDVLASQGYIGALQQACEAAMDVHR
jgi:hypothetical protein